VGWVAGPAADRFAAAHEDGERVGAAIAALARATGVAPGQVQGFVEDAHVFDWAQDPWTRGAYSWVPRGAVDAPTALAAPVGDRLFFAGEATDPGGDTGTVHGALATGVRAASEIRKRLT
jgi:monoamine oxidase